MTATRVPTVGTLPNRPPPYHSVNYQARSENPLTDGPGDDMRRISNNKEPKQKGEKIRLRESSCPWS